VFFCHRRLVVVVVAALPRALFVALLLAGTASTFAWAETPHAARSGSKPTGTAHATATLAPGSSATPEPPPGPQCDCQGAKQCASQAPANNAPVNNVKVICGDAQQDRGESAANQTHDKQDGTNALANWIIALGTIALVTVAIWVGRWQRELMSGSLRATEDTAKAALKNAEIVLAAERAWLTVQLAAVRGIDGLVALWKEPATMPLDFKGLVLTAEYSLHNGGKTAARIIRATMILGAVVEAELPSDPANLAGSRRGRPTPNAIVLPGIPQNGGEDFPLPRDHVIDVINGERVLLAYWHINYEDLSGVTRESHICSICRLPSDRNARISFVLGGPPAYNDYT